MADNPSSEGGPFSDRSADQPAPPQDADRAQSGQPDAPAAPFDDPPAGPRASDGSPFQDIDERIRALRRRSSPPSDADRAQPGQPDAPVAFDEGPPPPDGDTERSPLHDDWAPGRTPADPWSSPLSTPANAANPMPHYPAGWQEAVAGAPVALEAPRERRFAARAVGRHLREIAETIILALVIFLVVRAVVQNFQVEGSSMEPTLQSSWYLLVNKAAYWEVNVETLSKFVPFLDPGDDPTRYIFGGPGRGDVVVFIAPDQVPGQPERDFIKRIIGIPGETVEIKDCTVFINDEPLDEPYILEQTSSDFPPEVVPPDHYFVLGDNRNNSRDSRADDIGMIPKESIIGKAWVTYWPFDALGFVSDTSVEPGAGGAEGQPKSATTQGAGACAA